MENKQRDRRVLFMAAVSVGTLMNLSLGTLALYFKLPIYVNAMGTILMAVLLGIRASICVSVSFTLLTALLVYPLEVYYGGTPIALSVVTGLMAKHRFFQSVPKTILAGIILGIVAALASAPVTAYLFGGVPDLCCVSAITLFLLAQGYSLFLSLLGLYLIVEPADKILQCLLIFWLIRGFPEKLKSYLINFGHFSRNIAK